ncbi:MAG: hypothetical protein IKJ99_02430 [Oscillospiraceae bacterium]|nr:hypothetical protein [Oscillospiraceae bacterium]
MSHMEGSEKRWNHIRKEFPLLALEMDQLILTEKEQKLLKIIYAGLDCHDLPSALPERILEYVRASIRAENEISYAESVPEELFYDYVLPPRVNNEFLDGSRMWLYEQLRSRVQGKSIVEAALEVNFWCCERATYMSTDDRTIGPFGMVNRTRGRCGEESTLLVCALRAVGIPARQVYVPFWSHCDDNHAWVEFWADGQWHHMGACEPESVSDRGWFDSAASRALLVRSRVPDFESEIGYRVENSTSRYADTAMLKVAVKKGNHPVPGVPVSFQIINESRLATLHTERTDENGCAAYEFGIGSLIVSSYFDGRLIEKLVGLRSEREVALIWEDGFDPLAAEWTDHWELIPPDEKLPPYVPEDQDHIVRLHHCDEIRSTHQNPQTEIEEFRNLKGYLQEDKEMLLSTLAEKDFYDVSCDTLEDCLKAALPYKNQYPEDIWRTEILAPRVEFEMLQPVRLGLQKYFADYEFLAEDDVLSWMEEHLQKLPEYGLTDRRGNALEYVRHGVCPESEWEILAVYICRAVGIPTVLQRLQENTVKLSVSCDEELRPGENCSLSRWKNGAYRKVNLQEYISAGSYTLTTSRRQIDGTVSAVVKRFLLTEDREVEALILPDQTREKLKSVLLSDTADKPSLMIFLEPGAEPTEHLLLELLELKDGYNQGGWPVRLLARDGDNQTLRDVMMSIPGCIPGKYEHSKHYQVQALMGIGDARLPLAVVLDKDGNGVYASANYNIRTGQRLLQILKMIS